MTKADFAAYLILAWGLVSDGAVRRGWGCFDSDTEALLAHLQEAVVQ
jgi:hypothetical protein